MGIYLSEKKRNKSIDYIFVDELSDDFYENSLFRIHFKYETLKKKQVKFINEYLQEQLNNLVEILNEYEDEDDITEKYHQHKKKLTRRVKKIEHRLEDIEENIDLLLDLTDKKESNNGYDDSSIKEELESLKQSINNLEDKDTIYDDSSIKEELESLKQTIENQKITLN